MTHFDLKPPKILVRGTGPDTWPVPKVADWGLAKHLLEHSASVDGLTPEYAAPEQFDPETYGSPDQQTDVYQLGAVCYELFTGEPVFEGRPIEVMNRVTQGEITPPTDIDPHLPSRLDDILKRALARERTDRYESVLYLRDDLREVVADVHES